MIATAAAVAFIVFSCKSEAPEKTHFNGDTPYQIVDSMYIVQSKGGRLQMRVSAGVMERYDKDSFTLELFPKGIEVYAYSEEGLLETELWGDAARHEKYSKGDKEVWMAFGNVHIRNILKQQTIETDTLYWDQSKGEIYNDCYVQLFSPEGFIQGYGLRSDDRAGNASIMRPFNNYFIVVQDSTNVAIDSVNFIGPLLKK